LVLRVSELPSTIGRMEDEACPLERHMELLVESRAVLRVGLLTARLVTIEFAHPWVVQSFKLLRQGREKLEPFNRSIDKSRKEAAAAVEAPAESAEEPVPSRRTKLTSISQDEQEEPGPSKEVMETPKRKRKLTTSSLDDQLEPEATGTPSELTETPKRRKKVTSDSPDDQPELLEEGGTSKDQPEVPRRKRKTSNNSQTHQLAKTVDSLGEE